MLLELTPDHALAGGMRIEVMSPHIHLLVQGNQMSARINDAPTATTETGAGELPVMAMTTNYR